MKFLLVVITLAFSSAVLADTCDCTKIVGRCSGSANLTKSSGSKGNYSGVLEITSSAPSCSRVDYYVDNTPYSSVLNTSNKTTETVFGTSPVTKKSIEFKSCNICFRKEGSSTTTRNDEVKRNKFVGVWKGSLRWFLVSDQVTITINESNNALSGTWQVSGKSPVNLTNVSTTDTTMTVNFIGDDNGTYTYKFVLNGQNTAAVSGSSSGGGALVSFSGTMNKSG